MAAFQQKPEVQTLEAKIFHFKVLTKFKLQEKVLINRRVDKKKAVHIYNGILLSHKKNEISPFVITWMNLESVMLTEKNSQRKTNTM